MFPQQQQQSVLGRGSGGAGSGGGGGGRDDKSHVSPSEINAKESATIARRKVIITEMRTVDDLMSLLNQNPGMVLIKFGADWCKPCKQIKHLVDAFFADSPHNVLCADLNVDENVMLYSYLKRRRMVNGIPVILMYKYGNKSVIPTDSVTGGNPVDLQNFFRRCGLHLSNLNEAFARITSSA